MAAQIQHLIGSAFLLVLAIMCTVFACTIIEGAKNPLIVLALVFYIFSPIPYFICGGTKGNNDVFASGQESPLVPISHFLSGMFFTAGPCTAIVLYHAGQVSGGSMGLSLASGALLVAAVGVMIKGMAPANENEDF
jgi:ABC-type multidrug transport system permease subunit